MNVHDMRKTLPIRAKAMDPHQSLAETFKGILKKHRSVNFYFRCIEHVRLSIVFCLEI